MKYKRTGAGHELVKYNAACRAIAAAKSVDEVKPWRDKSIAMQAYAKQAKNRALEIDAAEIRLRAERRLGELIKLQKQTVGLNKGSRGQFIGPSKTAGPKDTRAKLADAGIDWKLSAKAQKLAAVPEKKFDKMLGEWRERVQKENERITASLITEAKITEHRQAFEARRQAGATVDDLHQLIADGRRFPVIYADPPWTFEVYSGKGKQRSAERHYDTMSLDDIKALPIAQLAADDCALLLWAVLPELPGALAVIEAWGFEYKTAGFVWVKQNRSGEGLFTGMGYWTRANAEVCLLATRGSPQRIAKDVHQVIMAPVAEHSAKPAEARRRIERLLTGPYLELFGRHIEPGWTCWGNEIELKEAAE